MVKCKSINGNYVEIPKEKITFRPSVYAIIRHDDKFLMLSNKSNGQLFFPGGGIEIDETIEEALMREVKEEAGIEIEIVKLIHFKEQFFYYDPADEAYHMFNYFYICNPKTLSLLKDDEVKDEEAEKPRWVDIEEIKNNAANLEAAEEIFKIIF